MPARTARDGWSRARDFRTPGFPARPGRASVWRAYGAVKRLTKFYRPAVYPEERRLGFRGGRAGRRRPRRRRNVRRLVRAARDGWSRARDFRAPGFPALTSLCRNLDFHSLYSLENRISRVAPIRAEIGKGCGNRLFLVKTQTLTSRSPAARRNARQQSTDILRRCSGRGSVCATKSGSLVGRNASSVGMTT
jgi:hypothetical protein